MKTPGAPHDSAAILLEKQSKQIQRLSRLAEVSKLVAAQLDIEPLLQQIVDSATHLLDAQLGGLLVYKENATEIEFFKVTGWDYPVSGYPIGRGILSIPYRQRINLRADDVSTHPSFTGFPEGHPVLGPFVSVPLEGNGNVLGSLFVGNLQDGAVFNLQDEETLMTFATQATIAIQNARLYSKADELARLQERQRISQALHDTIAQQLFSIGLESEWCANNLEDDAGVKMHLRAIGRLAAHSSAQVRSSIFALRGEQLPKAQYGSIVQLVEELVRDFELQSGVPTVLNASVCLPALPPLLTEAVYRIVLESLNNIKKHAQATAVIVSLSCDADNLAVVIQDNGIGLSDLPQQDPWAAHLHFGLETMRSVTANASGEFTISNNDDEGVMVRALFPISGKESA